MPDDRHPLRPYRAPDEREVALDELAAALGATPETIGHSVEGRPIRGVRIPARAADATAQVTVLATIHGVEYIATEVALGLLAALRAPDEALVALHERATICVVPCLNPDAYALTWAREGRGRLDELRTNARGVDLNRNFPLPHPQRPVWISFGGWRTGSDHPDNAFYRGEAPLSEPEAAAVAAFLDEVRPAASVSLHSTMGTLIPPCVEDRAAYREYAALCRRFAAAQPRTRYRRMASFRLDRYTGELEDHQHAVHGTRAICIEHYPITTSLGRFLRRGPIFWRFNPRDPASWVDNDVPGIVAFLRAALGLVSVD